MQSGSALALPWQSLALGAEIDTATLSDDQVKALENSFQLLELLGHGSFGQVYR